MLAYRRKVHSVKVVGNPSVIQRPRGEAPLFDQKIEALKVLRQGLDSSQRNGRQSFSYMVDCDVSHHKLFHFSKNPQSQPHESIHRVEMITTEMVGKCGMDIEEKCHRIEAFKGSTANLKFLGNQVFNERIDREYVRRNEAALQLVCNCLADEMRRALTGKYNDRTAEVVCVGRQLSNDRLNEVLRRRYDNCSAHETAWMRW